MPSLTEFHRMALLGRIYSFAQKGMPGPVPVAERNRDMSKLWSRMSRWVLPLIGLALAPSAMAFCGLYVSRTDSALSNETSHAILVREGNRTVLTLQNDFKGPLAEFVWVIPTPVVLEKGQVRIVDKSIFDRLDAYSTPRLVEHHDNDACQLDLLWGRSPVESLVQKMALPPGPSSLFRAELQAERDKALGVRVDSQYTLGEYDIVNLSATQSEGLETWLSENGYRLPKGVGPLLRTYLQQGMKFFAVKVNIKELEKSGLTTLRPLQFAYETDKFMLPLRLGTLNAAPDKPQDLLLYVLTRQGRVESSNYKTLKVPAHDNLPFFVKPRFKDVYRATFEKAAQREEYRAVFTEYFWDMTWCEPCSASPLSTEEMRRAGVFWLPDPASPESSTIGIDMLQRAWARALPGMGAAAQPVTLTRLHMRYTASSLTDDLHLVQTKDRSNWQARYVVQHPFGSSVAQCSAKMAATDCELMCRARLPSAQKLLSSNLVPAGITSADSKSDSALLASCMSHCAQAKQATIDKATRYYDTDLPTRLAREKQTLARLTGWSLAEINDMPNARLYADTNPAREEAPAVVVAAAEPRDKASRPSWWRRVVDKAKRLGQSLIP